MTTIRTRFAPSPTGLLHIGGVRTALYAWAFARHHGGAFVLRVEDTDQDRSTDASVQAILDGMRWLGLGADEGPIFQTDRLDRYRAVADALIASGHAYRCWDTAPRPTDAKGSPVYRSPWRDVVPEGLSTPSGQPSTIRFKAPLSGETGFVDAVKGPIITPHAQIEDWVLVRSNGMPTYNFAVVVDDADMAITHVIRGDDHVANTAKQIQLYRALGMTVPTFAHLPMILDENGKKLSKRTQGQSDVFPADVASMRAQGMLPDALLNYLARLGWAHGDDEVFSRDQLVAWFDLDGVSSAPARLDRKKLHWLNAQHLRTLSDDALWDWAVQQPCVDLSPLLAYPNRWADMAPALQARAADTSTLQQDLVRLSAFVHQPPAPATLAMDDPAALAWRRWAQDVDGVAWNVTDLDASMRAAAQALDVKFGVFASAVRKALITAQVSLPIPIMLLAMGRDAALAWVRASVDLDWVR